MRTRFKVLLLLLLLTLPAVVQAQFNYETNNGTITITGYTGPGGYVTIPSETNGLPVTSIGDLSFGVVYSWMIVTIPSSITNIGPYAFYGCIDLLSVYFEGNAPSVDPTAFALPGPVLYYLPVTTGWGPRLAGVQALLVDPPYYCITSNATITIHRYTGSGGAVAIPDTLNGLPVTVIESQAFWHCTNVTSVVIGTNVTSIGSLAFAQCSKLTSVTIPNSVTSIGGQAFSNCNLTNLTIPDGVATIGGMAFFFCPSLTSVTIPASVTNIGPGIFARCYGLTSITVDVSNPAYKDVDGVLFDKAQTKLIQYPPARAGAYTIASGVTSIEVQAFFYCPNLSAVTIPNTVTNIGNNGFSQCSSLSQFVFQGNAPTLGLYVFDDGATIYYFPGTTGWGSTFGGLPAFLWDPLSQLACKTTNGIIIIAGYTGPRGAVTIPDTINGQPVTSIGDHAFSSCTNLTNITIPNSVTNIGNGAFSDCTNLTSVTMGNGTTSIGESAFSGCTSLSNVTIPNSVTNIGDAAFDGCTSLTSITIPASVTSIGRLSFSGCRSLTSATIPNSVASIGDYAFNYCTSLTALYFNGNAPNLGGFNVFYNDVKATIYYLPGTTGWGSTFGGLPTALWFLLNPLILSGPSFGVKTNQFGFIISWATNIPVVVEACTNLVNPKWSPLSTNTLVNGSSYFNDPQWTNYPTRYYRIRSP